MSKEQAIKIARAIRDRLNIKMRHDAVRLRTEGKIYFDYYTNESIYDSKTLERMANIILKGQNDDV